MSRNVGLKVNSDETKIMSPNRIHITVEGKDVMNVREYTCLDQLIERRK